MEALQRHEPLSPVATLEVPRQRALTRKEFLATFQFSQGAIIFQNMIFRYLKYLHPEISLTPDESRILEGQSIRPAQAITNNAQRHARQWAGVDNALREATEQARAGLGGEDEHLSREEVVQALAERVLERDKEYLQRPNGRNYVSDPSRHYDPYKDSWRSDLCYFGFLGNTTGLADIDQMFRDVTEYWRDFASNVLDSPYKTQAQLDLDQVIGVFNQHHPNMAVEPLRVANSLPMIPRLVGPYRLD